MDEGDFTADGEDQEGMADDMSQTPAGSSIFDTLDGLNKILSQRAASEESVSDDEVYASLTDQQSDGLADLRATAADSTFLLAEAFAARAAPAPLDEWIEQGSEAEAVDYHSEHDSLVLVWDDSGESSKEPDLSIAPDPHDPEVMQVRVGNEIIADVYGDSDLQLSDIIMIPLSSAELANLTPA
ncbi:MAG: hypothetical protein AAF636_12495 [Pseudomonadota bacterium]